MGETEIRGRILLKLYEAFFLSFDWRPLRTLGEEEGWDRTTFGNVLDRLKSEGLIKERMGGFYILTGFGAVHAEETGIASQELLITNQKARALILNVLAKVYEEKGSLYSASMTDITEQTGLGEMVLKSNRQVLMDLNYMEAVGNAQFKITYRGLDAVKEDGQKGVPIETGRVTKRTSHQANFRTRTQVFFSYSRKDKKWLELFQTSLRPFIRANQISVWDDTKIKAGDVWRDEIKQALALAKVAVLLVSRNFLASDFIAEHELPPLLEAAQNEGLKILLVVVGHSLFEETEIGRYQAVNDPSRPLAGMSAANREKEIVRICREIKAAASTEGVRFAALTAQTEIGEASTGLVKESDEQVGRGSGFSASVAKSADTKARANLVCLDAKVAVLVTQSWTFYDLADYAQLKDYAFYSAVVEFENKPVSGRRVESLDAVEAQIFFYDSNDRERQRVESGAWVGESGRRTIFEVGRRKRLVIAFGRNKGRRLEISAAQNNRDTPDSNLKPTYLKLTGKWFRVYVRLIAHGEIVKEEHFKLEIGRIGILPEYLTIKRLPS